MTLEQDITDIYEAETIVGPIPDPIHMFLQWVVVEYPDHATAHELRRRIREVLG